MCSQNEQISEVIGKVAEAYHVTPVEGVLSHQLSRYVIDGARVIMNKPTAEQKVETVEIEENDVWSIDIVMSTGNGQLRDGNTRTTVFKREIDTQYLLKMKAARYLHQEVAKRFPTFPFTLRAFDEKQARLGITEMLQNQMVDPYPVLYEKPDEFIAQFKTTVFVLPKQILPAFQPVPQACVKSEYEVTDPAVVAILNAPLKEAGAAKKKKKKPAKK